MADAIAACPPRRAGVLGGSSADKLCVAGLTSRAAVPAPGAVAGRAAQPTLRGEYGDF